MTREQKLALIVGFSLILLVGVLISDHLSRARAVQVAGVEAEEQGIAASSRPSLPDAVHLVAQAPPEAPPRPEPGADAPVGSQYPVQSGIPAPDAAIAAGAKPDQPANPLFETSGTATEASNRLLEQFRDGAVAALRDGVADVHLPAATNVERLRAAPARPEPQPGADAATPAKPATTWYTVKPGETLFQIAKQQYGSGQAWRQIAELNKGRVSADGGVRAGVRIELLDKAPGADAPAGKAPAITAPKPAPRPSPSDQRITKTDPKPGVADGPLRVAKGVRATGPQTYTVKKGDSLGTISQRLLGTTRRKDEILDLNDSVVDDEDSIQVGMVLKMPAR